MDMHKKWAIRTAVGRVADLASVAIKCEESGDLTPLYDHMIGLLMAQDYNCGCPNAMIEKGVETLNRIKAYRFGQTERLVMLGSVKDMDWNKVV